MKRDNDFCYRASIALVMTGFIHDDCGALIKRTTTTRTIKYPVNRQECLSWCLWRKPSSARTCHT